MSATPSARYAITMRVQIAHHPGMLGRVAHHREPTKMAAPRAIAGLVPEVPSRMSTRTVA